VAVLLVDNKYQVAGEDRFIVIVAYVSRYGLWTSALSPRLERTKPEISNGIHWSYGLLPKYVL